MISPHSSFGQSATAARFCDPLVCVVQSERHMRDQLCQLFGNVQLPVRAFASAHEFLEQRHHPGPCCLVTEVDLPGLSGFDLQNALAGRTEQVVFLMDSADVGMCARAMKAGAVDFLLKPADGELLLDAVARALSRSESQMSALDTRSTALKRFEILTGRELEVTHRILAGMLNKQAALDLGIAEKTIKIHRGRVMRKLGVDSVASLVRLAMTAGIE